MEVEEYARIAAAEDDHWWYRSTRTLLEQLLGLTPDMFDQVFREILRHH